MSTQISIVNLHERLLQAAQLLSSHLHKLGVDHAYIGGFAWSLLGSQRPTQDVDVMVKVENPWMCKFYAVDCQSWTHDSCVLD